MTRPPDRLIARLAKAPEAHKYTHGHALVLAGGPGHGGAARLAARGALRIGAGLVTLACPPAALTENAAQLTAVMTRPLGDAAAFDAFLTDRRITAVCLGPGLGVGADTRRTVAAVLAAGRATVLDADALTAFRDDPPALFAALHAACVLTPHRGEFLRLFPDLDPADAPAAARAAARRAGCTLLLKGPETVIATPEGELTRHAGGRAPAPWLATAGSGDVLAGFITGLLARGIAPPDAAHLAAWLHAETARRFGPGLIAEDLPEQLPALLSDLLAGPPPKPRG